ncbi:MAG: polysaccharide deacetylase family protein [Bdellovibrionota bacterium]
MTAHRLALSILNAAPARFAARAFVPRFHAPVFTVHRVRVPGSTGGPLSQYLDRTAEVDLGDLRRALVSLKARYEIVPCGELLGRLGSDSGKNLASLTFDDGYGELEAHVAPLFSELGMRGTAFVVTSCLERGTAPWPIQFLFLMDEAFRIHGEKSAPGKLGALIGKGALSRERLSRELEKELVRTGVKAPEALAEWAGKLEIPPESLRERVALTAEGVKKLAAQGWEVGSHTENHLWLPSLSREERLRELRDSRLSLEKLLDAPVRGLCLPRGLSTDVAASPPELLAEAGYSYCCTSLHGFNTGRKYLRRTALAPSEAEVRLKAEGILELAALARALPWKSLASTVVLFLLGAFFFLSRVDNTLTEEDARYLPEILANGGISGFPELKSYEEEIAFIRAAQRSVRKTAPRDEPIPYGVSREPKDLYERGYGWCYDRSRTSEKIFGRAGFEVRHVSIYSTARTGSALQALLTPRVPSHAMSEVRTRKGWVLVGSENLWLAVDARGNPVSIREVHEQGAQALFPSGSPEAEKMPGILRGPFTYVYGLYSRHGKFFPPFAPVPDIYWPDFLENFR